MENRYQLKQLIILFSIITLAYTASTEIDFGKLKSQLLQNNITLPANFSDVGGKVEEVKKLLKDKCEKESGNEEAYTNLEKGAYTLVSCVSNLVDLNVIQNEIEQARPNGELDSVFHKYCLKRPEAVTCVDNFHKTLQPCLNADEKIHSQLITRVFRSLLNFVCYKGGDHIALFIAEGGPECLISKREPVSECLNKTLSSYIPQGGIPSLDNLPQFVIGPKQCQDILDIKKCVVETLESCKEVTPANIIESMFRYIIKNETDCDKKRK